MNIDFITLLKMGAKITLPYKKSLDSWYSEICISLMDKNTIFLSSVFDTPFLKINDGFTIEDAINLFIEKYKSPDNYAYLIELVKSETNFNKSEWEAALEYPKEYKGEIIKLINKKRKLLKCV